MEKHILTFVPCIFANMYYDESKNAHMTSNLLYVYYYCYCAIQHKSRITWWPFVHLMGHHAAIEKHATARMATYGIGAHAHWTLDTFTLKNM
jgi:hypothetical protein